MKRESRKNSERELEEIEKEVLKKIKEGSYVGAEWIARCFWERDIVSIISWLSELKEARSTEFDEIILKLEKLRSGVWT